MPLRDLKGRTPEQSEWLVALGIQPQVGYPRCCNKNTDYHKHGTDKPAETTK